MSMQIHKFAMHPGPEKAFTRIEFPDQLRDVLMQADDDDIGVMLRASQGDLTPKVRDADDELF